MIWRYCIGGLLLLFPVGVVVLIVFFPEDANIGTIIRVSIGALVALGTGVGLIRKARDIQRQKRVNDGQGIQ